MGIGNREFKLATANEFAPFYMVLPRHLNVKNPEFGIWDAVKEEDGGIKRFDSVEEAREFASKNINGREFYVLALVG
ncbi:hypothetical protein [Sporosarcina sp. FSL K6-5500]|uniref:hypothetical protein n=1 Tax=Sporosarcina sp. FSL K6-5500 TaxID=2921558 RepID=UPI0030F510E7